MDFTFIMIIVKSGFRDYGSHFSAIQRVGIAEVALVVTIGPVVPLPAGQALQDDIRLIAELADLQWVQN